MAKVIQIPQFELLDKEKLITVLEDDSYFKECLVESLKNCYIVIVSDDLEEDEINSKWFDLLKYLETIYGKIEKIPEHKTKTRAKKSLNISKGKIKTTQNQGSFNTNKMARMFSSGFKI